MLNETLFERALLWLAQQSGPAHAQAARRAFEEATGSIEEGADDYEARITHFLEQYLCEGDPPPVSLFARGEPSLREPELRELSGWLRSHRSLFVFEGFQADLGLVRDAIGGGLFEIEPSERDRQLSVGDRFDGRLIALGEQLWLSPGRVYHPREVHQALGALIEQLELDLLPTRDLLNGLLAMRTRFLKFESVRAEHVYQARALAPVHLPLRDGG
jgi:hypothetical protein